MGIYGFCSPRIPLKTPAKYYRYTYFRGTPTWAMNKSLVIFLYIGDYTTQLYRDHYKHITYHYKNPYEPTSIIERILFFSWLTCPLNICWYFLKPESVRFFQGRTNGWYPSSTFRRPFLNLLWLDWRPNQTRISSSLKIMCFPYF